MSEDAGKRCRKAEAVGQHVLGACLAEVFAEVFVAIENLTKDSLRTGKIHVPFFYRRTGWKPASIGGILLHSGVVSGKILFHQAVAVGAGPVEDVMRIFIHVVEVHAHGLQQILADGLRHFPAPLRVEVRIWHDIKGWDFGDVGGLHGLRMNCDGQRKNCKRGGHPNILEKFVAGLDRKKRAVHQSHSWSRPIAGRAGAC